MMFFQKRHKCFAQPVKLLIFSVKQVYTVAIPATKLCRLDAGALKSLLFWPPASMSTSCSAD